MEGDMQGEGVEIALAREIHSRSCFKARVFDGFKARGTSQV